MAREAEDREGTDDTETEARSGIETFFDEKIGGTRSERSERRAERTERSERRARAADRDEEQDDDRDEDREEEEDDVDDEQDDDESDDEESDEESDDDEQDDDEEDDDSDEDEESDEEDEVDEDDDDDELDPEVSAAAARHQLPTNFEDIVRKLPKSARAAARQAFQQRLKEVESGLGRAFQEARTERQELARVRAEREYEQKHPADYIADLIDTNPKLLEQLNEELEKRDTPAYRDAKKMTRDNERKELSRTADAEVQKVEQRRQRGVQVAQLAQRLARDAGVPFKLVDRALYAAIIASEEKDIPDEVIRRIVKQEARDWRKLTGERKTEKKKEYIQRKSKQIKDAKRRVTARDRGHAPAPGRRREPKDLRDALTRRAAAILPDAPE